MKSNFALSLSFDGLRLLHRTTGGWNMVGQVALDDADVTGALERLREAAQTLEPNGIATKLLIPNDQIKYIALDTTRASEDDVREALHGATPYAVDDLAYDFAKGGGRTYIAAVARETLDEAKAFAAEHGFNPASFAAVPEPFTYVGEAFFGGADGHAAERDAEPVIVIGQADVDLPEPAPAPAHTVETPPEDEASAEEAAAPHDEAPKIATDDAETTQQQDDDAAAGDDDDAEEETSDADIDAETDAPASDTSDDAETPSEHTPEPAEDDAPAPVFASRLRADRNEGRPAAPETSKPDPAAPARSEPTFSRATPPPLAVPTGDGDGKAAPIAAPIAATERDAQPAPTTTLSTDAPTIEDAPAITGQSASALPPEAASAAASLSIPTDDLDQPQINAETPDDDTPDEGDGRSPAASAIGAATGAATAVSGAVGGAVGGIFASRRMAGGDASATDTQTSETTEKAARKGVFGARKQPKPKPVVGGKPRFLGLILTAILLLFLLAIAAFAALSDENVARWLGFGSDDTQLATDDTSTDPAALEVAAVDPSLTDPNVSDPTAAETDTPTAPDLDTAAAPEPITAPNVPATGQVLTPEEAARIYAATGVWQRAPRIPVTPRTTSIDGLTLGTAPRPVARVPSSPLASASSISGDALIATPIDPPAPDTTFDFNEDGLIVATPDGNVTPDGILVIAGAPPLNPPTRPGTVAPEVTPQDQLAAVIPETAAPVSDAPEGVIVIAGRPSIEPPIRTGTAPPAPAPQAAVLATGTQPLVARDGLLVLAGAPPVLPPARPGTTPPSVTPAAVEPALTPDTAPSEVDPVDVATALPEGTTENLPEGLNVIAGAPPVLPPARPGTTAPSQSDDVSALTSDVTAALGIGTQTSNAAQTPTADTPRPLIRPAAVIEAAVAATNAPILGDLTATQASAFRPRTRPAGLAPAPVEPEPEPEQEAAVEPEPAGLQISPEIAAAVQAAANRPNPIVNPTAQAIPTSSRPDPRPRNMERIVARANQAQERAAAQAAATQQVATVAPRAVAPSGPTGSAVAANATLDNAINLRDVNLIGIYGGDSDRRALVRLANGRYVRVTVGDRLDGGRVTAISAGALSYTKRGRAVTLEVAG